jgi:hypothetical protein
MHIKIKIRPYKEEGLMIRQDVTRLLLASYIKAVAT